MMADQDQTQPKPEASPEQTGNDGQATVGASDQVEGGAVKRGRGRPTQYKPEYCQSIIDWVTCDPYVETVKKRITRNGATVEEREYRPNPLRFITAWARHININHATLYDWRQRYHEFDEAYARARDIQSEHLLQCGFMRLSDPVMTKFAAVNLTDLSDKTEVAHTTDGNLLGVLLALGAGGAAPKQVESREVIDALPEPTPELPLPGQTESQTTQDKP